MSKFSTANLGNKFTFGNKHNNPVTNELLWKATIALENRVRKISKEDGKAPHVEVNPHRNLLKPPTTADSDPAVSEKLTKLQQMLKQEQKQNSALQRKLDRALASSQRKYSHLLDELERPPSSKSQRKKKTRQGTRLPKSPPPPIVNGNGQVSLKNRQVMSHNLMNYAF